MIKIPRLSASCPRQTWLQRRGVGPHTLVHFKKDSTMKQVARLLKWCVVVTMFISGVPRLSHAVEMLPQGDFEAGVSDWIMWHCKGAGAVGAVYSSSDDIRPGSTGKRSLQIDTTEEFACSNFILARVFGLEGGKKYRMSIWYKVVAGGAPDGPVKHVIARDMKNDTNHDRKDLYFDMKVDGKWKYISNEFTAQASTTPEDFYSMMITWTSRGRAAKAGSFGWMTFPCGISTRHRPPSNPLRRKQLSKPKRYKMPGWQR